MRPDQKLYAGPADQTAVEAVPRGSAGAPRRSFARYLVPLLGVMATLFTSAGLSGLGDAPAPHEPAASMATHFQEVDDAILASAPFGTLGAVALVAFALALASRLHRHEETVAAWMVGVGGFVAAGYFLFIHVVYTTLADSVAASSADATKALFVSTILAVPVLGLGVAALLGGAAYGAWRTGLLPRWWSVFSAAGAALAAVAIFSYADSNFFSPDVQQQTAGGAVMLWGVVTGTALALRERRSGRQPASTRSVGR